MIKEDSWFKNQSLYRYVRQQAENKKFINYLEIGATFLLITIFLITAITPTASAISKLLGEIKSKEITSNAMRLKLVNLVDAQSNFSLLQEKFMTLESSYPSSQRFYQAASAFSSISRQSGTTIKQIKYNTSSNEDPKNSSSFYNVSLTLNGSYSAFLDMINQIDQGRRLVDIDSISINQTDKGLNLNLSTKLFYSPIFISK